MINDNTIAMEVTKFADTSINHAMPKSSVVLKEAVEHMQKTMQRTIPNIDIASRKDVRITVTIITTVTALDDDPQTKVP